MKIFDIMAGLVNTFLLKMIFPSGVYKSVINTQISVYNRLKKRAPQMPENELLNHLIISRVEAPPRVTSKEEEYAYYTPLLENPNKTLQDVIWVIVEYEYIVSDQESIFNRLSKIGFSERKILTAIDCQKAEMRAYLKESIERKVKKRS